MIPGLVVIKQKGNIQTPQILIAQEVTVNKKRRVKSKETTRVLVKALKRLSTTIMAEKETKINTRSNKSMNQRRKRTRKAHCKLSLAI